MIIGYILIILGIFGVSGSVVTIKNEFRIQLLYLFFTLYKPRNNNANSFIHMYGYVNAGNSCNYIHSIKETK